MILQRLHLSPAVVHTPGQSAGGFPPVCRPSISSQISFHILPWLLQMDGFVLVGEKEEDESEVRLTQLASATLSQEVTHAQASPTSQAQNQALGVIGTML